MLNRKNQKLEVETLDGQQLQAGKSFNKISKDMANNKNLYAKFKLIHNNKETIFTLKGQKAKTLKCLVESKSKGCTALEISRTFALRLSEYIRALRHDNLAGGHNLEIVMIREKNPSNWHGRYFLKSNVEIL